MKQSTVLPEIDELTKTELQPPCEIATSYTLGGDRYVVDCRFSADWAGLLPCCGLLMLVCDRHRNDGLDFQCVPCQKSHADLINWSKL